MSERQMWDLAELHRRELWHPDSPRRARRGGPALLVLVLLASAGAACGLAGDGISVGSCAHFVTTLRTNEQSYAPGQTVIITVTEANEGPGCTMPPQPCDWPWPPAAFASAYNPAGKDVWDYGARKTIPGTHITCPPEPGPSMTWTAYYSDTQILDWGQDECTLGLGMAGHNPDCPGTQVPAGTYRIVGVFDWSDWNIIGHGPSASVTITISS